MGRQFTQARAGDMCPMAVSGSNARAPKPEAVGVGRQDITDQRTDVESGCTTVPTHVRNVLRTLHGRKSRCYTSTVGTTRTDH
eukprot:9476692-Pyramimonas_sp.AAC.1